ncbi:hypothetical protein JCM3775_006267 [Rhodotorula graminis]|uniref:Uncharacterized protein n=1 Tax=Rhodotorula graminis (strain WP1) TaxID=578459 RepID=A0A194S1N8_RHOGW|nr:uncharacterized protein RHOBADRAFT_53606 [Rhodotorula graminis WP1]KPV74643.1 hypothetical protein RHOBADRAFT_53606 [Rhodotorula graminis WP1]
MPSPRPSTTRRLLGLTLAVSAALALPSAIASPFHQKRAPVLEPGGYYNPTSNGGKWLTLARNADGKGEPLNAVVVLDGGANDDLFDDWSLSINFGSYLLDSQGVGSYVGECLGQSDGARQAANLGDGQGMRNQTDILRENFGDVTYGTCRESAEGGEHFRVFPQVGPEADSGAYFLAASSEEPLSQNHMIVPNGYDLGRDEVVRRATVSGGTKSPVTNRTFETTATNASGPGYFANVSIDEINHGIATDGVVAVLNVKVTSDPVAAKSTSAGIRTLGSPSPLLVAQSASFALFALFALALLA